MNWLPTPRHVLYFQLAFAGVVLASYADLALNVRLTGEPWQIVVTFVLGGTYFLLAHLWPVSSTCDSSPANVRAYFALQCAVVIGALVLSPTRGFFAILALPLVSQALFDLKARGALVVGLVIYAATIGIWWETHGWRGVGRAALSYIPGYLFTIAFTMLARGAFRDRQKAEKLSSELSAANDQLRAHAAEAEKLATIQERNRLAREIHDGVGHYLTVIKVQLDAASALLPTEPARAADSVAKAARLAGEALDDVRRSVGALAADTNRPPLAEALRQLAAEVTPPPAVHIAGTPRPLGAAAEHALYRAAQEGLTNVRKHAAATLAELTLDFRDPTRVRLVVVDDGRGAASVNGSGYGLRGLRERLALLGGTVDAHNRATGGFTLTAEIPA